MAAGVRAARPVIIDVTDAATIEAAAAEVGEATGGRLAGLVNNAGASFRARSRRSSSTSCGASSRSTWSARSRSPRPSCRMIRAARGRVVFMSSIGGRIALPHLSALQRLQARARGDRRLAAPGDAPVRGRGVDRRAGLGGDTVLGQGPGRGAEGARRDGPGARVDLRDELDRVQTASEKTAARGSRRSGSPKPSSTRSRPTSRRPATWSAPTPRSRLALRKLLPDRVFDRLIARELSR